MNAIELIVAGTILWLVALVVCWIFAIHVNPVFAWALSILALACVIETAFLVTKFGEWIKNRRRGE